MNIDMNELMDILLDGLCYDGGHHKQYYLEQALELICPKEKFDELKEEYEWEEGMPA